MGESIVFQIYFGQSTKIEMIHSLNTVYLQLCMFGQNDRLYSNPKLPIFIVPRFIR